MFNTLTSLTSGIGDIFGDQSYASLGNLLNIQMKMLENMSSKIDLIKDSLDSIIKQQEQIEHELHATPSKTVKALYENNIEGLFLILREKMEAFIIERDNGTITDQKISLIFDEVLRELQLVRGNIMSVKSFVNIPLIAVCLNFETLCMVFARQPHSYMTVVLQSYKKWFASNLEYVKTEENGEEKGSELMLYFKRLTITQNDLFNILSSKYVYTKTKTIIKAAEEDGAGKYAPVATQSYEIHFKKFLLKPEIEQSELDKSPSVSILLKENYLTEQQIFQKLTIDTNYKTYQYSIKPKDKDAKIKPIKINEEFIVEESHADLIKAMDSENETPDNNKPSIPDEWNEEAKQYTKQGEKLIMYAAYIKSATDAINVIERILQEKEFPNINTAATFYLEYDQLANLNSKRVAMWESKVNEYIDQLADAEEKEKIAAINKRMQELKNSTKNILEEYAIAQAEFKKNLPKSLFDEIIAAIDSLEKEIEIGIQNIGNEAEQFGQNLGKNLEKGIQDIGKQLERDTQNLGMLAEASVNFVGDQIMAYGKILSNAEKRIREGKIIDAIWHCYTDSLKYQDENLAKAVQKSSLLNAIASSAASIYGGPGGAAAYAAWYTYKLTNNLELALRTGIITGLTSYSTKALNATDGKIFEPDELLKRTIATSAIGAASIAASGGDEKAVIEGFLKGMALSLASNHYKKLTEVDIEGRAPTQDPVLKLKLDYTNDKYFILRDSTDTSILKTVQGPGGFMYLDLNDGFETLTLKELGRSVSVVGLASATDNGFQFFSETAIPMRLLATIPYMNDMAFFHDLWCDQLGGLNSLETAVTILPATILTVAGSPTPLLEQISNLAIENKNKH